MRLATAVAALAVILGPQVTVAQSQYQNGTASTTTMQYSFTTTITKTLIPVSVQPTQSALVQSSIEASTTSSTPTTLHTAAATTVCTNCMINSAAGEQRNLAAIALAGAAILLWELA